MIRQYTEVVLCTACGGSGQHPAATVPMPCPVCEGKRVISRLVTETTFPDRPQSHPDAGIPGGWWSMSPVREWWGAAFPNNTLSGQQR
jgi:predicted RNA-binding Zn-ribbon protein involved in translation (DUF1610 family)